MRDIGDVIAESQELSNGGDDDLVDTSMRLSTNPQKQFIQPPAAPALPPQVVKHHELRSPIRSSGQPNTSERQFMTHVHVSNGRSSLNASRTHVAHGSHPLFQPSLSDVNTSAQTQIHSPAKATGYEEPDTETDTPQHHEVGTPSDKYHPYSDDYNPPDEPYNGSESEDPDENNIRESPVSSDKSEDLEISKRDDTPDEQTLQDIEGRAILYSRQGVLIEEDPTDVSSEPPEAAESSTSSDSSVEGEAQLDYRNIKGKHPIFHSL